MGWTCPGCGRCYSPFTPACTACPIRPYVSTGTGEVQPAVPVATTTDGLWNPLQPHRDPFTITWTYKP